MSTTYSPERIVDEKGHIWRRLDFCVVCKRAIKTMCFRGTGVCSGRCKKKRDAS